MSLLNKVLSWFGLGKPVAKPQPTASHSKCVNGCNCNEKVTNHISVVSEEEIPVRVERDVTLSEVLEAAEEVIAPVAAPKKRTSSTKKPAGTSKPRAPRKKKEEL